MPIVLTIAGSDPSGGAGIQSDLRTFQALGMIGLSAISALTVQNSQGVQKVYPTEPEIFAEQLQALFEDAMPDAVKIGVLGGAAQVQTVAEILRRYRPPNIVLDPVLASTGGAPLLDEEGMRTLLAELMPLCDLITPNLQEASRLTAVTVNDHDSMQSAGRKLLELGAKAVLVKGGHLTGDPFDLLVTPDMIKEYRAKRVPMQHAHGTGCLFSSAIASSLASGGSLAHAIAQGKQILSRALDHPTVLGKGRGYPTIPAEASLHSEEISKSIKGLYVITDSGLAQGRSLQKVVTEALAGGARIIQLREKSPSTQQLVETAHQLRAITHAANALLIINDRVDVALACHADGVHLGPDDMPPQDARRLLGPDRLVGVSTGTLEEAKRAAPYASYFGVGAIYGTRTKSDAGDPIGLDRIREIKAAFPEIPLVAIGGINNMNIREVAQAGADCAAVVSAVVGAPDIKAATASLIQHFESVYPLKDSSRSNSRSSGSA